MPHLDLLEDGFKRFRVRSRRNDRRGPQKKTDQKDKGTEQGTRRAIHQLLGFLSRVFFVWRIRRTAVLCVPIRRTRSTNQSRGEIRVPRASKTIRSDLPKMPTPQSLIKFSAL